MTRLIGLISVDVERRTGSYGVDGIWVDTTPCTQCNRRFCVALLCDGSFSWREDGRLTISASVQFGAGVGSDRQDEGERGVGSVKVFTAYPLRAFSTDVAGDLLLIDGRKYRVVSVENWRSRLAHYVAVAELWDEDIEVRA